MVVKDEFDIEVKRFIFCSERVRRRRKRSKNQGMGEKRH